MTYSCCDELRRQVVRNHPTLNGIDFLEVVSHAAPTEAERQQTRAPFCEAVGIADIDGDNIHARRWKRITTLSLSPCRCGRPAAMS